MKNLFSISFAVLFVSLSFSQCTAEKDEIPITKLFTDQADSIVLIKVMDKANGKLGSGFVVSEDGLIFTNYHVVSDAKIILVKLKNNKRYRRVHIVNVDALKDIALLKITGSSLKTVKLGDSDTGAIGQRVATIGNPLGLESTVSDGLISNIRDSEHGFKIFQISVPLSNGSSGGPLFNLQGEVIGITTAAFSKGENLNFAVPINYVKPLLKNSKFKNTAPRQARPHRVTLHRIFLLYNVQPKDTLYHVAREFHASVSEIMRVNNLSSSKIYAGQQLRIPVNK